MCVREREREREMLLEGLMIFADSLDFLSLTLNVVRNSFA